MTSYVSSPAAGNAPVSTLGIHQLLAVRRQRYYNIARWLRSRAPFGTFGEALALSTDGCLAATCDHETPGKGEPVVRVWSVPDLRELWKLNLTDVECRDIACALAFTPDARRLVIAGWEGAIRRAVLPF